MHAQAEPETTCPRCGQRLAAYADVCHRCGLRPAPGVTFLAPPEPVDPAPPGAADAEPVAYERKTVRCLPMDLERIARAESVDGWTLLDTTVDPDVAGDIVAHFRRPVRARSAVPGGSGSAAGARGPGRAAQAGDTPAAAPVPRRVRAGPTARPAMPRSVADAPADAPEAGRARAEARDPREILYVVLLVIAFILLVQKLELLGLFIGIFVLPALLRNMLGISRRRRRGG